MEFPKVGRGLAVPANDWDLKQDAHGLTNPNLHRRKDPKQPPKESDELLPRDYDFEIASRDSYRTTHIFTHDEESIENEVP